MRLWARFGAPLLRCRNIPRVLRKRSTSCFVKITRKFGRLFILGSGSFGTNDAKIVSTNQSGYWRMYYSCERACWIAKREHAFPAVYVLFVKRPDVRGGGWKTRELIASVEVQPCEAKGEAMPRVGFALSNIVVASCLRR